MEVACLSFFSWTNTIEIACFFPFKWNHSTNGQVLQKCLAVLKYFLQRSLPGRTIFSQSFEGPTVFGTRVESFQTSTRCFGLQSNLATSALLFCWKRTKDFWARNPTISLITPHIKTWKSFLGGRPQRHNPSFLGEGSTGKTAPNGRSCLQVQRDQNAFAGQEDQIVLRNARICSEKAGAVWCLSETWACPSRFLETQMTSFWQIHIHDLVRILLTSFRPPFFCFRNLTSKAHPRWLALLWQASPKA